MPRLHLGLSALIFEGSYFAGADGMFYTAPASLGPSPKALGRALLMAAPRTGGGEN